MFYRLTQGLVLCIAALVFTVGCATRQPAPESREPAEHLPPGADMYFGADLRRHHDFVLEVFDAAGQLSPDMRRVLNNTDQLTVGMRTLPDGRLSGLYVAGRGSYSVRTYETGLRLMRDWERAETRVNGVRYRYWRNRNDGFQLIFLGNHTMLFASDSLELMIEPPGPAASAFAWGRPAPTPVALQRSGTEATPHPVVLADMLERGMGLFIPEPSRRIVEALPDPRLRVPLVELALYLSELDTVAAESSGIAAGRNTDPDPRELELSGALRLEREQDARVFSVIARLAVISFASEAGMPVRRLMETLDIRRDGTVIVFRGIPMTEESLIKRLGAALAPPLEDVIE